MVDLTLTKTPPHPNHLYYVDQYGMMLRKKRSWEKDDGLGDALWRTSIAYLIYKNEENSINLLNGITSCFVKVEKEGGGYYYQAYRHPTLNPTDTSRDQVNAAIAALYLTGHKLLAIDYAKHLPIKISPKFKQTIDFRLWLKTISTEGAAQNRNLELYFWVSYIMGNFVISWNRIIRKLAGFKSKPLKDFKSDWHNLNKIQKILAKMQFPTYAFFLWVLQIATLPNSVQKNDLCDLLLKECEPSNYALRLLLGDSSITENVIKEHISQFGLRWNNRLDDSTNDSMRALTDEETEYNDIDLDFLKYCFKKRKLKKRIDYNG